MILLPLTVDTNPIDLSKFIYYSKHLSEYESQTEIVYKELLKDNGDYNKNIYREGHKTICVDLTLPYDKENEEMDRKINTLNLNYSMTYDGKKISTLS